MMMSDDDRIGFIKTPLENIHIKTAEAIYLNGGKTTFRAKARQSRFYGNSFLGKSKLKNYFSKKCCAEAMGPFTYYVSTFCLFLDPSPFCNQIRHWIEQKLH